MGAGADRGRTDPSGPGSESGSGSGSRSRPESESESEPAFGSRSGLGSEFGVGSPGTASAPADLADDSALDGPDRWCYAGEGVESVAALGDGWVAVTTHRLLLFDPSDGGRRLLSVDRPNVLDVRVDAAGTGAYLEHLPRVVVYALALLGGRVGLSTVDTGALLGAELPSAGGIGGLSSLVSTFRLGFELLSAALLLGGVGCVAVSLLLAGLYVRSRRRRFVVERAGAEPIERPLPTGDVDVDRLRTALRSDDGGGNGRGPGGDPRSRSGSDRPFGVGGDGGS